MKELTRPQIDSLVDGLASLCGDGKQDVKTILCTLYNFDSYTPLVSGQIRHDVKGIGGGGHYMIVKTLNSWLAVNLQGGTMLSDSQQDIKTTKWVADSLSDYLKAGGVI